MPAGPHGLGARDWVDALKRSVKEFVADDCLGLAQQIAFASILAFFPALIMLIGLLGLFGPDAYESLKDLLGTVAPQDVLDAIDLAADSSANQPTSSLLALVLGTLAAVWIASGATAATIKAVNRAYDRLETRPLWKVRLIAIALLGASGLVTAALFLLIVFGGPLGEAIADQARLGSAFNLLWGILRWPIAVAAMLLFFALVYYIAPNKEPRNWQWISPGALVGAALWLAISGLFALYTSFADSYDRIYGSLAGVIVLLLWLYYSAFAVLLGAELNAELDRQADIRAAGGPQAGIVEPGRRTA